MSWGRCSLCSGYEVDRAKCDLLYIPGIWISGALGEQTSISESCTPSGSPSAWLRYRSMAYAHQKILLRSCLSWVVSSLYRYGQRWRPACSMERSMQPPTVEAVRRDIFASRYSWQARSACKDNISCLLVSVPRRECMLLGDSIRDPGGSWISG